MATLDMNADKSRYQCTNRVKGADGKPEDCGAVVYSVKPPPACPKCGAAGMAGKAGKAAASDE